MSISCSLIRLIPERFALQIPQQVQLIQGWNQPEKKTKSSSELESPRQPAISKLLHFKTAEMCRQVMKQLSCWFISGKRCWQCLSSNSISKRSWCHCQDSSTVRSALLMIQHLNQQFSAQFIRFELIYDSPVHRDRHRLLVKIPRAQQVCAGEIGGVEPPGSLMDRKQSWSLPDIATRWRYHLPSTFALPGWGRLRGFVSFQSVSAGVAPGLWEQNQNPGCPMKRTQHHQWPLLTPTVQQLA